MLNTCLPQNDIDSFLLDREHIIGSVTATPSMTTYDADPAGEGSPYAAHGDEDNPREGWPYMNYSEGGNHDVDSGTNFRTWARGGAAPAGFAPSSGGHAFL